MPYCNFYLNLINTIQRSKKYQKILHIKGYKILFLVFSIFPNPLFGLKLSLIALHTDTDSFSYKKCIFLAAIIFYPR